jgi:hypothetical protein
MTKISTEECLKWTKEILWINQENGIFRLNRPLTVFMAIKK